MRRAVLIAFAAVTGGLIAANPSNADAKDKRVAYFVSGPTNSFIAALDKAFLGQLAKPGIKVTEFDTPYDPSLQSQQIDDAIARKFDLFAVVAASAKAIVTALVRVKQAGVPVLIVNNTVEANSDNLYQAYVGVDNYKIGRLAGEAAVDAVKRSGRQKAKVALITGTLAEGEASARVKGFNDVVKNDPHISVVATEDAQWDSVKSEQIAGQLFVKYASQGGLDVIYAMADNQATAVIRAAHSANIKTGIEKGKLIIVSSNCDRDGVRSIQAGEQFSTVAQTPVSIGKRAGEMAVDFLNGKQIPKSEILPATTVTKKNVGDWMKACTY